MAGKISAEAKVLKVKPPLQVTDEEGLAFLLAVERGLTSLSSDVEPKVVQDDGVIQYVGWGGQFDDWEISVAVHEQDWEMIVRIKTADGRQAAFDDLDEMPKTDRYMPSEEVTWVAYGLPGCTRLGTKKWDGCLG